METPNDLMQGVLRLNSGVVEIFNGSDWLTVHGKTTSIGLSPEVESLLIWVRKKKQEEELVKLAKEYPTVQGLIEKVENAKKQLDVAVALIKDYND